MKGSRASRAALAGALALVAASCAAPPRGPTSVELAPIAARAPVAAPPPAKAPPLGPAKPLRPADLAFVTTIDGHTVLVLDAAAPDEWRDGPPELAGASTDPIELRAGLDARRLPETHRLGGRRFALYRGAKRLCEAEIGAPRLVGALYEPSMDWAGSAQHSPPATQREIADEAWSMASKWLVADVALGAACDGATWARLSTEPSPTFVAAELSSESPSAKRAWGAFATLAPVLAAQPDYDQWNETNTLGAPGPWLASPMTEKTARTYAWRGASYTAIGARIGEGCGFNAAVFAIYRVDRGRTELVAQHRGGVPGDGMLVDLNLDGHLEDLGGADGTGLLRVEPFEDEDGSAETLEIASPGCPC